MTCRELIAFLDAYLDGALTAAEREAFLHHLGICPSCVHYLDGYQRAIALGKAAFADADAEAPESVPEELVRAVLAARKPRS